MNEEKERYSMVSIKQKSVYEGTRNSGKENEYKGKVGKVGLCRAIDMRK